MNSYEKIVAQREQRAAVLRYQITCKPRTKEGEMFLSKGEQLKGTYTFYYDDPEQSEEERRRLVRAYAVAYIRDTLQGVNTQSFGRQFSINDFQIDYKKERLQQRSEVEQEQQLSEHTESGYLTSQKEEAEKKNLFQRLMGSFTR